MKELNGKISDRIRITDPKDPSFIPSSALTKGRTIRDEEPPSAEAIRSAKGQGLGQGAERRRNGGAS